MLHRNTRREEAPLLGATEVRGILGNVVRTLGCRVVSGQWSEKLPREADLIEELGVSRSVVREALRTLTAKGLIRSRPMEGTKVQPRSEWRLLDPDLISWTIEAGDKRALLTDLMKVRLVMEPGVVYAATELATDEQRAAVTAAWNEKLRVESDRGIPDLQRRRNFITADLAFHQAFINVVGSEILDQLIRVVQAALRLLLDLQMQAKGSTVKLIGMDESTRLHADVYDTFMRGNPEEAEQAMRRLIQAAIEDAHQGFKLIG